MPLSDRPQDLTRGILIRFVQVTFVFVVQALILFVASNRPGWLWAWVFIGICVSSATVNSFFMLRTSPETIAERGRARLTKNWDRIVSGLWALAIFLAVPLVAGLDARLGWMQGLNPAYNVAGALLLATGLGVGGWAMISNTYFSTAVRIQTDRGHTVCRSGPYRFVRHPGYAGFVLQSLGTPILLGSFWALIPGLAAAALMVTRTAIEDRMLQSELPGYPEFVQEVKYRLIPRIW